MAKRKRNLRVLKPVVGATLFIILVAVSTIVLRNISYTGASILFVVIGSMYLMNWPFAKFYRRPGLLVFSIIVCLLMGLVFLGTSFLVFWVYISAGRPFDLVLLLMAVLFTAFVLVLYHDIKEHVSGYKRLRHQVFALF